jgi:minor extracellular serine protease Vpr
MFDRLRVRRGRALTGVSTLVAFAGLALSASAAAEDVEELTPLTPAPSAETGLMTNETTNLWFVELSSPPAADGTSASTLKNEKAAFRSAAKQAKLAYTERYAFDTLWNGLSVRTDPSQIGKLSRIPGVSAVYPVATISLPEDEGPIPDLATALAMTGADIAQNTLGYTGSGIKVAVMDTGIDYDHADLGGDGVARSNSNVFPTSRVLTGWDFVGDAFNADPTSPSYNPTPTPDQYPDDCAGHGTHVSGIVGASGAVTGVAPGVTFGAYRVFGCEGSTTADIMIAAMERALRDHMDVLNMSIGSAFQWPQYPTATAADRLVNNGVSVVASIGNSGANGLYSTGAPGNGNKVIGVASFDNTHISLPTFTVTPAGLTIGYTNATGAPAAPTSGSLPLAKTGTPSSTADGCAAADFAGVPAGSAVLIRRGTCSFYQKSFNAQNAGAAAVVLYNNVAGRINPTVAGSPPITIPVVAVSDTEGVAINNAINSGAQTLNWTDQVASFPNPTGGLISSFSSYGLAPDLSLKPDIGAPGGFIRSTWPLELGGYASISGTSMASPHVAGAVALLLQAMPDTSSQAVRSMLQNSAVPKPWWGNPGLGFLDNVHRQGAGMLRIDNAILATTKVDPGKLALGESEAGPQTRTLTIRNLGASAVTYDLSHAAALATGPSTFSPSFFNAPAAVAFTQAGIPVSSVVAPAGGSTTVDVTITANAGLPDRSQYGGYVVLTPQGGGQVLRVPFAGFKGDYQSIQVLVPTANGFPWLARCTPTTCNRVPPASSVFNMTNADNIPYVLVHLDHQSRKLQIEVFDAVSGKAWHRAVDEQYLGRNSTATGFFAFPIDGTTSKGPKTYTLPDGTYTLTLSVLKALGDAANPAHWETWTSPAFTIDRP